MRRVAVTGLGVVSPIGVGLSAFKLSLLNGVSGIASVTRFDASTYRVRLAGEVKSPLSLPDDIARIAEHDPKIGFAYAACDEALGDAGIRQLNRRTLLHLGVSLEIFDLRRLVVRGHVDFNEVVNQVSSGRRDPLQSPLDGAVSAITRHWGVPGRTMTNCSACAAGAQAIGQGFHAVRSGRFDVAVCGGFDSMINPLGVGGFQLLGALSEDNDRLETICRPFDESRSGLALGEGAGLLVLEPFADAEAAGKTIYAEVCGYGGSLDAYKLSAPSTDGDGAIRAMRSAILDAGISPDAIGHINAHGTGTILNDAIEAGAIRTVFSKTRESIPVSATKSMTGHLIAAAGAIEAVASVIAVNDNLLPANISLRNAGAGCELNHVKKTVSDFQGDYVLSNSFGFGGQNASLIFKRARIQ